MITALQEELSRSRTIPFSRFMELALGAPGEGYYERENEVIGSGGDFYTSVSSTPLFAELLAYQFADWAGQLPGPQVHLVEAGAHRGGLALGILRWVERERPKLLERMRYLIVEPSATRRSWQAQTLEHFAGQVRWVTDGLSQKSLSGVIFSNELLDAMPVRRISWDASAKTWFEWGVTLQEGILSWTPMTLPRPDQNRLFAESALVCDAGLEAVLPDGFTVDLSPAAMDWWAQAARALTGGWLLTIDYGLRAAEFFDPSRGGGTLRSYQKHRVSSELLRDPGQRDLTAHVNFSALQQAGEQAGLRTDGFSHQEQFLGQIAGRLMEAKPAWWTPARRAQLQTLIHPEHLGRPFRVLVQHRAKAGAG